MQIGKCPGLNTTWDQPDSWIPEDEYIKYDKEYEDDWITELEKEEE